MRKILESILELEDTGFWFEEVGFWLFPILLIISADYEEQ